MPEFYTIFVREILFPQIFGVNWAIPGSKAETERTQLQHQLRDHGGHRSSGTIVLKKLFKRLFMLIGSINPYA